MEIDLGKLKFTWKGAYAAATTYEKDDCVSFDGSTYVHVGSSPTTGTTPETGGNATWELMSQGYAQNRVYQSIDNTARSFGASTLAAGMVTQDFAFSSNSNVLAHIYVPARNDDAGSGGLYVGAQYRLNSGAWVDLGNSGHSTVMNNGATSIGHYKNCILISPNQAADFTLAMRLMFASFSGTVYVNDSGQNNFTGDAFKCRVILEEKR